jgi:hypothetical protein
MGIADDEADAAEATRRERADEGRPGRAFVVAGRQLEPEDATLTAGRHPRGHERGHVHHPATDADLHVGRVQPEVGIASPARERPRKASTSASSAAQMRLTWLRDIVVMPRVRPCPPRVSTSNAFVRLVKDD